MMNPIYKFTLTADGESPKEAAPVYKDDLSKDYERESGQQFFRAKLSGKLTFVRDDYDYIVQKDFETEFGLAIAISYDAGQTWAPYWEGRFWKTDCTFNEDDRNLSVTPSVRDRYSDILNSLDKEFNLIELAPEIRPVSADKRPLIQVYLPGQTVMGCFLSGMYWEQPCQSVLESDTVTIEDVDYPALTHKYHFAKNRDFTGIVPSGTFSPALPQLVTADQGKYFDITSGGFRFVRAPYSDVVDTVTIYDAGSGDAIWQNPVDPDLEGVYDVDLDPVPGGGGSGRVTLSVTNYSVYSRIILDVDMVGSLRTHDIPDDDICDGNRNYSRCIGYAVQGTVWFTNEYSTAPTEWGLRGAGEYYAPPYSPVVDKFYPVSKSSWGRFSVWFAFSLFYDSMDVSARNGFMLRDAFPLHSVIARLLEKVAPGVTHEGTTAYSAFLYGVNPLVGGDVRYLITPKSNVVSSNYDQPAQKAPVTLAAVLSMLRDCFRCYWFIDDGGRFRIEHIRYFLNGGSYDSAPGVGRDLTTEMARPYGKRWSFATSAYQYDKPDMAARYQFGWMDEVTDLFNGNPMDILSRYVSLDNIEEVSVQRFTSDLDYILLNPGEVSKDGFVLLSATAPSYRYAGSATAGEDFLREYPVNAEAGGLIRIRVGAAEGLFDGDEVTVLLNGGPYETTLRVGATVTIFARTWVRQLTFRKPGAGVLATGTVSFAIDCPNELKVPYLAVEVGGVNYVLQNGYCSFFYLQNFYRWDMPAWRYTKDGEQKTSLGVKKLKSQTVTFPAMTDPDTKMLIKTDIGEGVIDKVSVNLSSRLAKATLKYDF